jgi:hypothetical protein
MQGGEMKLRLFPIATVAALSIITVASAANGPFHDVRPSTYDPAHTFLVESTWLSGIGCPTNAKTYNGSTTSTYTDSACTTGDSQDRTNQGLLLAKTGPTGNYAAAQADLIDVPKSVTELGYDIRKPRSVADPSGSHCGAGAPRFNVNMQDGTYYFVGCSSPPPTTQTPGTGWLRLRWGAAGVVMGYNAGTGVLEPITGHGGVQSIQIVFDEGQDTGPDNFGLAVLDNIDVNGTLVGHAPANLREGDHDENNGSDSNHHHDQGRGD